MKIELFITDMDGTAVNYPNEPFHSSWDTLSKIFSDEKREEWFKIRDFYLKKGNDFYKEWFNKQVSSLKGISVSKVEEILFPIPYSKGFKEFFINLNGVRKAILSAGVDVVAKKIAEDLHFDYLVSQDLEIKNGFFTGKGNPFDRGLDKSRELVNLCKKTKVSSSKVCYIGDTPGDISCFELVNFPVAFEPKLGLEDYVKENNIPSIDDFRDLNQIFNLK